MLVVRVTVTYADFIYIAWYVYSFLFITHTHIYIYIYIIYAGRYIKTMSNEANCLSFVFIKSLSIRVVTSRIDITYQVIVFCTDCICIVWEAFPLSLSLSLSLSLFLSLPHFVSLYIHIYSVVKMIKDTLLSYTAFCSTKSILF